MKIKLHAMIFYGVLKAFFYLVIPLLIIYFLETYGIMQFSDIYVLGILIIGVIGTAVTILNHTFKKDTVASGYASIVDSIYSAIFLFYIFGGFTPGVSFGTYEITYAMIHISIGIQLIAYLMLIAAGIKLLQHVFRTAELKKDKEYHVKIKRKFRASKFFKVLGTLCSLILVGYIISIPASAVNIDLALVGTPQFNHWDNGTLDDFSDDLLNMSFQFNVNNGGVYSIFDIRLDISLRTYNTTNTTALPDGEKIGGTPTSQIFEFRRFSSYTSQNFTIILETDYIEGLLLNNATLRYEISFTARYAGIDVSIDTFFNQPWENKTYIP